MVTAKSGDDLPCGTRVVERRAPVVDVITTNRNCGYGSRAAASGPNTIPCSADVCQTRAASMDWSMVVVFMM